MKEYLSAPDAIELIQVEMVRGYRCLGADGIEIVPKGFMGRLDLIIDVSGEPMALDAAAEKAIDFIRANSAENIVWDVVIGEEAEASG